MTAMKLCWRIYRDRITHTQFIVFISRWFLFVWRLCYAFHFVSVHVWMAELRMSILRCSFCLCTFYGKFPCSNTSNSIFMIHSPFANSDNAMRVKCHMHRKVEQTCCCQDHFMFFICLRSIEKSCFCTMYKM